MKDEFYEKVYTEDGMEKLHTGQIRAATVRTPSIVVVDHFFNDPDEVRNWAIGECKFKNPEDHGAVGYRSEEGRKIFDNTKECIEKIMNGKIVSGSQHGGWDYSTNGCFQWCPAGTPIVYHADSQQYAGAIFLTPDAPREGGTSFWKHKATGLDWMPQTDEECQKYMGRSWQEVHNLMFGKYEDNEANFLDGTAWEKTDEVANIYNRLVIWDARKIHSASAYFGDNIHNSRLFQLFFFNLEREEDNVDH